MDGLKRNFLIRWRSGGAFIAIVLNARKKIRTVPGNRRERGSRWRQVVLFQNGRGDTMKDLPEDIFGDRRKRSRAE